MAAPASVVYLPPYDPGYPVLSFNPGYLDRWSEINLTILDEMVGIGCHGFFINGELRERDSPELRPFIDYVAGKRGASVLVKLDGVRVWAWYNENKHQNGWRDQVIISQTDLARTSWMHTRMSEKVAWWGPDAL